MLTSSFLDCALKRVRAIREVLGSLEKADIKPFFMEGKKEALDNHRLVTSLTNQ